MKRYQKDMKGFCIECLFPHAMQNYEKYNDAKSRRDFFICKGKSHDTFPTKT